MGESGIGPKSQGSVILNGARKEKEKKKQGVLDAGQDILEGWGEESY